MNKLTKTNYCWNWNASKFPTGYGRFWYDNGSETRAHRVSWIIFKGKIPKGLLVCHRCDNRLCVNPDHLFIGSHKDNMQDCLLKNRYARIGPVGQLSATCKLSEKDVRYIFKTYTGNHGEQKKMAEKYGVSRTTIYNIFSGKSWNHITKII